MEKAISAPVEFDIYQLVVDESKVRESDHSYQSVSREMCRRCFC